MMFLQAYFMQIDSTLNKLTTVCTFYLHFLLFYVRHTHYGLQSNFIPLNCINLNMQLREYIDDSEDYINIQVGNFESNAEVCFLVYVFFLTLNLCILFLQLDNHRNQLIQVLYDFFFMNCVVGSKQALAQIACMF